MGRHGETVTGREKKKDLQSPPFSKGGKGGFKARRNAEV